jgi:hypothetical protein
MANDTPQTRITQALRDQIGVPQHQRVSHPVDLSDIRRWAIAVHWPDAPPRLFWDEDYARTTRFGGIIAPREFNPFSWPAERPAWLAKLEGRQPTGERGLNGGTTETYGAHIRPGDVISTSTSLVKLEERVGRLGLTLYLYHDTRWTNQRGEWVKTRTSISLWY